MRFLSVGDQWLMFYFGFYRKDVQCGVTFSKNYILKIKFQLILHYGNPRKLDEASAHRPSMVLYNNTLYHFHPACRNYRNGDQLRIW